MSLIALDKKIFFLINHLPHNQILDKVATGMHFLTNADLIYLPILAFLFFSRNEIFKIFAKLTALSLIINYLVNDLILKNLIHRLRPFQDLTNVIYLKPAPHNFSFPSGEAASAFAFATLCWLMFPKKAISYFIWGFAIIVGIDRIYMGHHLPSDVLAGGAIGIIISWIIFKFSKK